VKYYYDKPDLYLSRYGSTYSCNHPIYDKCTLYKTNGKGLAVIQQRYNERSKSTYWGEIDPWLVDSLYFSDKFVEIFDERAEMPIEGIYPTVSVRQLMWALRMKPLPKKRWETCFDRRFV